MDRERQTEDKDRQIGAERERENTEEPIRLQLSRF